MRPTDQHLNTHAVAYADMRQVNGNRAAFSSRMLHCAKVIKDAASDADTSLIRALVDSIRAEEEMPSDADTSIVRVLINSIHVGGGVSSDDGTSFSRTREISSMTHLIHYIMDATASGLRTEMKAPPVDPELIPKGKEIAELRMTSGLSWDELGQIFRASRQEMQFWASGEPLDAINAKLVMQVLDVARHADRGTAVGTRAALHDTRKGTSPFDLLVKHSFDDAREALGPAMKIHRPILGELDEKTQDARRPLPLEVLLDARQDSVHKDLGPSEE